MTRKIPKLKKHEKVVSRMDYYDGSHVELPVEPEPAEMALPVGHGDEGDDRVSPIREPDVALFPDASNDLELKRLIRNRAFFALKARMIEVNGEVPADLKDEMSEMERSL